MSGSQKAIKVISIIAIIIAIITIVISAPTFGITYAFVNDPSGLSSLNGFDEAYASMGAALVLAVAALAVVSGILSLLVGIFGLRGANDPMKILPFFAFAIIGFVCSIIGLIVTLVVAAASGTFDMQSIISSVVQVVVMLVCVMLANNVRKQRARKIYGNIPRG